MPRTRVGAVECCVIGACAAALVGAARPHGRVAAPVAVWPPHAAPDSSPFRPLALPPPDAFRDASGRPGTRYWQQRVNYQIDASLDTARHLVSGREAIRYVNHSPDTLRLLWLQLDQNLYAAGSRGATRFPDRANGGDGTFRGGYTIDSVAQIASPGGAASSIALTHDVQGTLMRVELARAISPGDSASVRVVYRFEVPQHGSDRTGRTKYAAGWVYGVAQWYPRLAVYDDVRGWNLDEYLGQAEFYLEYGDFHVAMTVPRGFLVAATGHLENPGAVLAPVERRRLAAARRSDSTIAIIGPRDVGRADMRPSGTSETLTWRFTARNVRDFSWAASPAFVWDATGWNGVLVQSFYPADADPDWSHAADYVRKTIQLYSTKWLRYPYPTATTIGGPTPGGGGMEYPMIAFNPSGYGGRALRGVTIHEMGHQWFPMVVGSNERRYGWMDEGITTFINNVDDWSDRGGYRAAGNGDGWVRAISAGHDGVVMTPSDSLTETQYDYVVYSKPAMGLYLLRHEIVVDTAAFDSALRAYVTRWAFKHPTPADFFRSMNDALGTDLSWFWRGWFYRTDRVDLGVDSVTVTGGAASVKKAGGRVAHLYLGSHGELPMPVPLRITLADGSVVERRLPVDVWRSGPCYRYDIEVADDVATVEIDPDHNLPDVRRENNVWRRK